MTYDPRQLSPASQEILAAMTEYHRERLLLLERDMEDKRRAKAAGEKFSLARAVMAMGTGRLDGAERSLLEKTATLAGVHFDPQRVFLPWAMLKPEQRDLTVASAGSAGYLVATSVGSAVDVLRGWSVVASAGITHMDGLVGDMVQL